MGIVKNKLTASEGMTLTDGEAFGKTVYLASGADASRWYEITDAEAEVLKRDLEEAAAADYESALEDLGVEFDAE